MTLWRPLSNAANRVNGSIKSFGKVIPLTVSGLVILVVYLFIVAFIGLQIDALAWIALGVASTIWVLGFTWPLRRLFWMKEILADTGDQDNTAFNELIRRHTKGRFVDSNQAYLNRVKEIRETVMLNRAILDMAADAIVTLDQRGRIELFNQAAASMFGYTAEEARGLSIREFNPETFDGETDEEVARHLELSASLPPSPPAERIARRKDGTKFPVERTISRVEVNERVLFTVIIRDITQRRQHKAQEMLANAVYHDLRSPLAIIGGYSEMLLRKAQKQQQESSVVRDLRQVVRSGRHLVGLTEDLLNLYSERSGGGVRLDEQEFDLREEIRALIEGFDLLANQNGNEIHFPDTDDPVLMRGDKNKVLRVLINLLTNACRFTKNGLINVGARREPSDEGDRIVLSVADNGMGMDAEQLARFATPFEQEQIVPSPSENGFGIGLISCKLYCNVMGGCIEAESTPDRGTTFTVRLPARSAGTGPATNGSPSRTIGERAQQIPVPDGDVQRDLILVINDDLEVRQSLKRFLTKAGLRVRTASGGLEGLRLAKELKPAVIVLDALMPDLDGWYVLATLKRDPDTNPIPIVMASMDEYGSRGYAHALEAAAFLVRPFRDEHLVSLLRSSAGGWPVWVLIVEDDENSRRRWRNRLRTESCRVDEAKDCDEALRNLEAQGPPDLILIDLKMLLGDGFAFVDRVRTHPTWKTVKIVLALDAWERDELNALIRRVLQDRGFDRSDFSAKVQEAVARQVGRDIREHSVSLAVD